MSEPSPAATVPGSPAAPTGVIHDIGYRHYEGRRLGRGASLAALTLHSLRGLFGLGRTARAKIMPFLLAGVMMLPAVVSIAIMVVVKQQGVAYPTFAVAMQAVLAVFLAAQAPYLVAPDLRFRVLPLYLSRPVTRADYITAKLAAMAIAMFLLLALPITVTYIGELLVDLPGPPHTKEYFAALAGAVVFAVLLACVGVAIASFTPRRGLGVAAVIAVYLLASGISVVLVGVLMSVSRDSAAAWAWLVNPFFLVDCLQVWLFGTTPNNDVGYPPDIGGPVALAAIVALIALSVTALVLRYRKAAAS
ncbi:membrane protein [Sphaerisporangium siamense]|uniref:ABC-2 type transport system permease protein n=1 Tax=Sphaerisporangium siamense TaxID=795645 RepID=A0A7W7DFZ7_9ACTN|nr:ABC transporter permease subunit [Sphaerisporangium siamense]MBB4706093.1 ABC-2 type transport system permease protein [Sphaerisporangium siamense]GII89388.1 membrane protein [Sphaerisporangium siamense]